MDHIKDLIPEAERNAITTNSEKSLSAVSPESAGLPEHWTAALFARFQARYGHKWTSAVEGIEETAVDEWSAGLAGFAGDQIARGLDDWQEPWPPSLPEFRDACLGAKRGLNEFGLNYVPEYYRQPPKITDRSRLLSSDERDANREKSREHVAVMRQALKGATCNK